MNPIVSIIVPNFNHEAFLEQRLESVFNQTYQNFEVILLDDCSTDNSKEILSKYAKNPKVSHCIFNETNSGNTFIQWNKGIALAKGEFIWIAESDDFCELNFLEVLIQPMLQNNKVVLSYCQSNRVNEKGSVTGNWLDHTNDLDTELFLSDFIMKGNEFIERFLIYKNVIPNASALVFRKDEVLNKIGSLNTNSTLKYCGDWLFYFQLAANKEISYHAKLLNNFRYHSGSVIANATRNENLAAIKKIELNARNEIMTFLKSKNSTNFKEIEKKNSTIRKQLNYEKALFFIRNNEKVKGYILLLSVFSILFKNGKMKKYIRNKILNVKNKFFSKSFINVYAIINDLKYFKKRRIYLKYFKGKKGIEIGGPSTIFSHEMPIYKAIKSLDGCNFGEMTVWEGNIFKGENYNYFENKYGYQYICEASSLNDISDEKYEFLIASHCLEHCANTLKTVKEWLRVIKKGGVILLVLPDKRFTFDHNREVTSFEHLIEDYSSNIDETNLTHITEILELHDLNMDTPAGTIQQFKQRSLDNYNNRCLHHHIFDFELLHEIYDYFDIEIIDISLIKPYHQLILGVKK